MLQERATSNAARDRSRSSRRACDPGMCGIASRKPVRTLTGPGTIQPRISGKRLRRRSARLVSRGPAVFGDELGQGVAELVDAVGGVGAADADGDAGFGGVIGGGA